MKYIDLFGGIGGFSYGIEQATEKNNRKWECVWYCDNDKYSVQTYNKNFGTKYEATDISTIKTKDIPKHDIICAGFPCQTFSLAGKRKGFEDVRGTMFFEIMRIAKSKRTKYLFLENVKGLLNHDKGKTFTTILQTLEELGYEIQWMVLNSKFFGVPQNRERVFIIANIRGTSKPKILPFRKDAGEIQRVYENKQVGKAKEEKIMFDMYNKSMRSECPTLLEPHHNSISVKVMNLQTRSENRPSLTKICPCGSDKLYKKCCGTDAGSGTLVKENETYTLDSQCGQGVIQDNPSINEDGTITALDSHYYKGVGSRGNKYRAMVNDTQTPTLTTELSKVSSNFLKNWIKKGFLRRLTPTECERLQGFPDGWTEGVSDTQRYKQCGNAVTTNVIEAIITSWQQNGIRKETF